MTERYTYGLLNRPAMYGTVPDGFIPDSARPHNDAPYGVIDYPRPLSAHEMWRYELLPVSASAYPYPIGARVLVNEVDEGEVVGFETNHRYVVRLDSGIAIDPVPYRNVELLTT